MSNPRLHSSCLSWVWAGKHPSKVFSLPTFCFVSKKPKFQDMGSTITLPPNATLTCIDCGVAFVFSGADQDYYLAHDFSSPTRCKPCRALHKIKLAAEEAANAVDGGSTAVAAPTLDTPAPAAVPSSKLERWPIICSKCGKPGTVPFMPKAGQAILCRACYSVKA